MSTNYKPSNNVIITSLSNLVLHKPKSNKNNSVENEINSLENKKLLLNKKLQDLFQNLNQYKFKPVSKY
jgi:hypothetical protein